MSFVCSALKWVSSVAIVARARERERIDDEENNCRFIAQERSDFNCPDSSWAPAEFDYQCSIYCSSVRASVPRLYFHRRFVHATTDSRSPSLSLSLSLSPTPRLFDSRRLPLRPIIIDYTIKNRRERKRYCQHRGHECASARLCGFAAADGLFRRGMDFLSSFSLINEIDQKYAGIIRVVTLRKSRLNKYYCYLDALLKHSFSTCR